MKKLQAVLLCALVLAVLAAADLGYNFFASLVPEINDGISVRGVLAPLLFSDHLWALFGPGAFLNAFVAAAYAVGALAAANVVDCVASRIMRGKITAEEERRFCALVPEWCLNFLW